MAEYSSNKIKVQPRGLDTKFDALKMKAHFKNDFGCIPFLAMEALEIKRIYEIADHALALPAFFTLFQPRNLDTKFDVLKMKAHFKIQLLLVMQAKSRNRKDI